MDDRFQPGGSELPVVVDHKTGLMWQRDPPSESMDWDEAISYADQLSQLFHGDWRLPTVQELVSIVDYDRHSPAIDQEAFPKAPLGHYWSSSTLAGDKYESVAWRVQFYNGMVDCAGRHADNFVRCVRGGK